jgi:hypothetical protein
VDSHHAFDTHGHDSTTSYSRASLYYSSVRSYELIRCLILFVNEWSFAASYD